jgi:peptide-methionine (R)-S-oxide reductase
MRRELWIAFALLGLTLKAMAMEEKPNSCRLDSGGACGLPSHADLSSGKFAYELSAEQWRARLSPQQYAVLRQQGTERAFVGEYWNTKTAGTYQCAGCGEALFASSDKFDSGTGWPSYTQPIAASAVGEQKDTSHGMVRVEVHCANCGGHLGHLFEDGPAPTGRRYCINSLSLRLEPSAAAK